MRNSWIIALREIKERLTSRTFLLMSILGPVVIIGLVYLMFKLGGENKQHWNVLISDPAGILNNKVLAKPDAEVTYSVASGYIEIEEFADAKLYQSFDALIEVNEKILSNKIAHAFYRTKPSASVQGKLQYQVERRVEEVMIDRFTKLSIKDFRKIKQPINFSFRNVYDPNDQSSDIRGWVGFVFGIIIFTFIGLFGMTILRSVTREKSNRIVEVLLACVKPSQLMSGKIIGIGLAALFQFVIWLVLIGIGLLLMREYLFPDVYDAAAMNITQVTQDVKNLTLQEQLYGGRSYNELVDLVYERIQFGNMLVFFVLFFIAGYLFYSSFFATIGSTAGTESDGQQFILPIMILLIFGVYSGYYVMMNPESSAATWFQYLPFTAPMVVMVKLAVGYAPGHVYEIWLSLIILVLSAILCLKIAARLYKNGVLQFGHRLRLKHIVKWLKMK